MKKILTIISLLTISFGYSQVYDGYADNKHSVGFTTQSKAMGLSYTMDRGINDYLSYGVSLGFIINHSAPKTYTVVDPNDPTIVNEYEIDPSETFLEKLDFNFRLNTHFNKILNLGEKFDAYLGPNVGRNIGGQIGTRFLILDNFGFFAEANIPFKKRLINLDDEENGNYYKFYEQPVFSIGIVFSN